MWIIDNKSVHIDFAYRKNVQLPVAINNTNIPYSNTAKYLEMNLDIRLRWKEHTKKKRRELDLKYKKKYTGYLGGNLSFLCIINCCYTNKFQNPSGRMASSSGGVQPQAT
jgi:hypothetical protein